MLSAIRLKRIRFKEQKKLSEGNLRLYKNITEYIQSSNLTLGEKEEILQQIMDMMLQAQIEDKCIDLFIGKDYEVFCKSIIDEYNNSKSRSYKIISYTQKYLMLMILIVAIMGFSNILNGDSVNFTITMDQFIETNALCILIIFILKLKKQGIVSVLPAYVPEYIPGHKRINSRININDKSIIGPIAILMIIMFCVKFIIEKLFGLNTMNYNINLYDNIYCIVTIPAVVGLMEIYKRTCDNK